MRVNDHGTLDSAPTLHQTRRIGWLVFGLALSVYITTTGGRMATDIIS
jgi:hypothetical protein